MLTNKFSNHYYLHNLQYDYIFNARHWKKKKLNDINVFIKFVRQWIFVSYTENEFYKRKHNSILIKMSQLATETFDIE